MSSRILIQRLEAPGCSTKPYSNVQKANPRRRSIFRDGKNPDRDCSHVQVRNDRTPTATELGLCYHYDDWYTPNHACKKLFWIKLKNDANIDKEKEDIVDDDS